MKNFIPVVAVLALALAVGASAGTRYKDRTTVDPVVAGDGIPLADSIGCRISARVADGGNVFSGTLIPMYRDNAITNWTPAHPDLWCSVTPLPDGGVRAAFPCPDIPIAGRFGLISVAQYALKGADGGTGAACVDPGDAGCVAQSQPTLRVECWGPAIP